MRIHIAGYSNGGYMAHRFVCERPDLVAAIASFAGATPTEAAAQALLEIEGFREALREAARRVA